MEALLLRHEARRKCQAVIASPPVGLECFCDRPHADGVVGAGMTCLRQGRLVMMKSVAIIGLCLPTGPCAAMEAPEALDFLTSKVIEMAARNPDLAGYAI